MPFFLEATFATGVGAEVMNGEPVQNFVLEWQRTPDDRLLLVTPNLGFRAQAGSPLATAVARSFPEGYLAIFTIKARQAERKSLLIDVSDLFTGDFTGISGFFTKSDDEGQEEEKERIKREFVHAGPRYDLHPLGEILPGKCRGGDAIPLQTFRRAMR